jgi:hypothetical protein
MNKFKIKEKIEAVGLNAYNLLTDVVFALSISKRQLVKNNSKFRDIHRGERCFVFGTGPSLSMLSETEVTALQGEVVFATNSFYKIQKLSRIFPKYYALLDNLYWTDWADAFSEVSRVYNKAPPTFITDTRANNLALAATPASHIYIYSKKFPTTKVSANLETNIYAAMNVVSYSILTAVYMGFKEINLLGCDYTAFCKKGRGHAYDDTQELAGIDYNLAFYLKYYWLTTEIHYLIQRYARHRDVRILNLTPGSLLDAYECGSLPDHLLEKFANK